MVPWLNAEKILDRQRAYDPAKFQNECLGLPTALGDHVITREQIEACCRDVAMANSIADVPVNHRSHLIAGIDWSGGGIARTVLVIGYIDANKLFTVVRFERFLGHEDPDTVVAELVKRCRQFRIAFIAADGGNGLMYNKHLLKQWGAGAPQLYAVTYGDSDQEPRRDNATWAWRVYRSGTLGGLFGRIKNQMLLFPRASDCGSFLDDFTCEIAEYDDYSRTIRYTHPDNQTDDALHATNYAQLAGLRLHAGSLGRAY
jgi:hypothetical protein